MATEKVLIFCVPLSILEDLVYNIVHDDMCRRQSAKRKVLILFTFALYTLHFTLL